MEEDPRIAVPSWARPPDDGRPQIRTIGPRRGRLLPGHRHAFEQLSERYRATPSSLAERVPFVLDVGAGDGASTVALAAAAPESLHVAVDVHRPGLAQLLRRVDEESIGNVLVVEADVWDVFAVLPPGSLLALQSFFPDPWPKTRHHRRRLITADFVTRAAEALVVGGELRFATDWPHYAEQMRAAVRDVPAMRYVEADDGWSPRFEHRPVTTYERRGLAAGRPPRDIRAIRR